MNEINNYKQEILDAVSDGILVIDRDFNIVFANKAMLNLCRGLTAEDVNNKKCYDLSHGCPMPCPEECPMPCPEECLQEIICPHAEGFQNGRATSVVHTHTMLDGTKKTFNINSFPIRDEKGHVAQLIQILRDITEMEQTKAALIKSEEFIKNILDTVDEGFIVIDPEYRIISANKAYCEQVKCTVNNIVGEHCYDVSHHLDRPCFDAGEECAPAHTFKTGEPCSAIHTHYDSEGNPVYIETKSYPMKDASGKVTAAIETLNNITEKKKLEDQLLHAQKMEAIGTLAGGIAHDFNNILTAIMGYANIVQMKMQEDDPQRHDVAQILESAERAAELTHSLLAFSREQVMNMKPLNLNELILHMERFTARLIGENIEIRIMLGEGEMIMMADSGQIEQVVMNLIINARDAMPDGGVLTIRSKVVDTDEEFLKSQSYLKHGRYVLVSVSDTGIGMDEETKRRIFEPFFTTKEMGHGTGLGLALVYGIVKQHNGYILVDSEPGKGTLFRIYFPSTESPVERKQTKKHEHLPGGGETILVAEDDGTLRKLLQTVLTMGGYKTIMAEDGDDAVHKFKEKKDVIQLVLLDMLMPKKSGKEAYDEIIKIKTGIKAIFISGYTANGFKGLEGLEKDVALLSKPIMPGDLLKRVREVLDEQV